MNTGKIVRRFYSDNFTIIPNTIAKSENLSLDERGLLVYILSLPSDWVIYKKNLYNSLQDKQGTIDRAFKSLQAKGYIHSYKVHGESGKFIGWDHIVYDEPKQEKPKVGFTEVGETAPILRTDLIQKTNKDKVFSAPTENEVISFFLEKGDNEKNAKVAFEYYSVANWKDSRGKPVKNWKQKMLAVWINKSNFNKQKTTDYELRKNHYSSIMQWAATIDGTEGN